MFDRILQSSANKICVIAAPGSGKTSRALIPKVAQVLADPTIDPKNVLLLTFSRLSAKDLKERASTMDRAPRASTVHSLCLAFLLSENSHGMRTRVESIVLDFEKDALLSDLKLIFPRKTKPQLKKMLDAFSVGWATRPHDEVFEEDGEKRDFKAAIVSWLSEHEAAMMEEIVYGAVNLARQLGTAEFIQAPQHIFIDEYQDLNRLEQEFINLLAAESRLLFIVGDPDQSIYSFKYSYPNGIRDYATMPNVEAYSSHKTGRCPRKVVAIANQLLLQANPGRTQLLESMRDDDGEVRFVQKENQDEEFAYILRSVAERLSAGATPQNIIVLVPKKPLGVQFVEYANTNRERIGVQSEIHFKFDAKVKLTEIEQERVLLFGLAVKPDSLLHIRGYLALGDSSANAVEIKMLKNKYGNLARVLELANPEDFTRTHRRVRALCERIIELRAILNSARDENTVDAVIDRLFSTDNESIRAIRTIIDELREEDDTLNTLYSKLIDHMRTIPTSSTDIRVMTLMGSKGLEAEHVYILGCNAGNLPGSNRSHLSEHEHKEEQRRLLFVGVTRASKSLTISWARHIPFMQSMRHHTQGLRAIHRRGQPAQMIMGLSEFLQDLTEITWEI
jgi:DNA helicase-2/ATP-dependent DNA helicase PcrA